MDDAAQQLAQLHSVLIEAVDLPNLPTAAGPVFVEREQRTQTGRVEPWQADEIAGAVAGGCEIPQR